MKICTRSISVSPELSPYLSLFELPVTMVGTLSQMWAAVIHTPRKGISLFILGGTKLGGNQEMANLPIIKTLRYL